MVYPGTVVHGFRAIVDVPDRELRVGTDRKFSCDGNAKCGVLKNKGQTNSESRKSGYKTGIQEAKTEIRKQLDFDSRA